MTGFKIGYARDSTDAQDLTAQRDAVAALGVPADRAYVGHGLTGTNRPNRKRPVELQERQVGLRVLQQGIDTTTAVGRLFFHILAAIAEFCVVSACRDAALPDVWGLLPDAVSTGRGRPVCGWSRSATAALSVELSCLTMRATKSAW